MTTSWHHGYRWRTLSPEQNIAIREALAAGAGHVELAKAYGVSRTTIYREAKRLNSQQATVTVFGQSATFVQGDNGQPIRMTPWFPRMTPPLDSTGGPFPLRAPVEASTAESVTLVRAGGRLGASTGVPRGMSGGPPPRLVSE